MRQRFTFLVFLYLFFLYGCRSGDSEKSKITVRIHYAYGFKVVLEAIPFSGETEKFIDSATVKTGDEIIYFYLPANEERAYILRVDGTKFQTVFINDSTNITVEINNIILPGQYKVYGSKATNTIQNFLNIQLRLMDNIRNKNSEADSLKRSGTNIKMIDSLKKQSDVELINYFQQYVKFEDTVSSPGAFLYLYNNVDFGNDFAGLKKFMLRNAKRFPANKHVQKLKDETLDYLKIFEEEYNVGDVLPELTLPDVKGINFSTYSLKGKYVFIDFWSTWCGACLRYDKEKEKAKKIFSAEKFEIISIALDSEKDAWKNYLEQKKYNWPQLIDEKMWNGPTLKTYKIDSIPFNFFLGPNGKILAKAIKPDSVIAVISNSLR
jgi:thiol-disulfide isomerase/thioredoxin/signal peptidase I